MAIAFAGCRSAAAIEREELTVALGQDPAELLRALASNEPAALGLQRELRQAGSGAMKLRVLRFGLAHVDERVVFGATKLLEGGPGPAAPVPELRHATAVVLPRLGESDCPIRWEETLAMFGSSDFAAIGPALARLSDAEACKFLGELHRMVRAESIPALCAIARSTEGRVREVALSNACLAAEYSQEHVPLVVETCLALVGRTPDPDTVAEGLPGLLTAALRAHCEGLPALPVVPGARWLVACTPAAHDLRLLQALLASDHRELREAAAWSLGALRDAAATAFLRGGAPDGVDERCWTAARARGGDDEALETLFALGDGALPFALTLATPERRHAWFEQLLALPRNEAELRLATLGWWASGELDLAFCGPPYDDRYLAELEPMVAAAPHVDPQVLRALVGSLPSCQTGRLADRLLRGSTADLFAEAAAHGVLSGVGERWPGHHGAWAFLEVTRPEAFGRRLREGFADEDASIRDVCAEMLVRLGDTERIELLAAWLAEHDRGIYHGWIDLARDGGPAVVAVLTRRLAAKADAQAAAPLLPALAVALGMPRAFAQTWDIAQECVPAVREALLAGDAAGALLQSHPGFSAWSTALLARWPDERLHSWTCSQRATAEVSADEIYLFDQLWALATDDRVELERMLGPVRDGRYATHYEFSPHVAAWAEGLSMLPFWIDQLGSNCCKCVFAKEVMQELFGCDGEPHARSRSLEPTAPWLRRTLLPVADRLRWSRIANCYVVAGR